MTKRPRLIVIDKSPSSLVVHCTECPGWSDVFTTRKAATDAAVDHEIECHPEQFGMRKSRENAAYRNRDAQKKGSALEDF